MSAPGTGLRLTVIGCSGSFAGPDSAASSYLVEADDADGQTWRILLDLGSGALGPLQRYGVADDLDGVFFSHLHPDHCLDLTGLYVLRKYHPGGALPRIPVWGPEGVARRMATAYDLPEDPGMSREFDFREHADAVDLGPFRVTPYPVAHPVPAFGFQVTAGGRTLGYTGDTGPCRASRRSRAVPICCSRRRRSATARTTPPTSTSAGTRRARSRPATACPGW